MCLVIYAERQQLLSLVDLVHRGDLFHQEPKPAIESLLHAHTLTAYCMQVSLITSIFIVTIIIFSILINTCASQPDHLEEGS